MNPSWRGAWPPAVVGLLVRLGVVAWAHGRFPPVADGTYYHAVAQRIAAGEGYTWLWPDGAVTYAAHYPIGYPALIGALYAVFGASPTVAMILHAGLGALAVVAAHRLAGSAASASGAALAAWLVALHPGLIAYTPALMTEGVVAALLPIAAVPLVFAREAPPRHRWAALVVGGLVFGLTTLVRPQVLLLAPLFALVALPPTGLRSWWLGIRVVSVVTALVLAVCLPWTLRNCFLMGPSPGVFSREACVFVSANGGWNLLIGAAPEATGAWVPIERVMPTECREVWGEVDKDRCFWRAGQRHVVGDLPRWLALAPAKLRATFDSCGAAGYYLHAANSAVFSGISRERLDHAESTWQRLVLLLGALAVARAGSWRAGGSRWLVGPALLVAVGALGTQALVVAYLALGVAITALGRTALRSPPAVLALATIAATAATHVLFFGAGRYSMVTFVVLAALAGTVLPRSAPAVSGEG